MEVPQPLSLFDRPNLAQKEFSKSMQDIADKNGVKVTFSANDKETAKFEPKNNPNELQKQLASMQ